MARLKSSNDHEYDPSVVITIRSFPHSLLITRVTRWVPRVEQDLLTLPEHLSYPPVFSVARSLVFCVVFCSSLFVLVFFFFWPLHCLSFFDVRLMIVPLVSSHVSQCKEKHCFQLTSTSADCFQLVLKLRFICLW